MMAEQRKRIVPGDMRAGFIDGSQPPADPGHWVIEEWTPAEPTEEWTDWKQVGEAVDADPTYTAEYDQLRASIFHVPLKALHPHRKRTITFERKLVRRWVDAEQGPMAQVVDTEQRTERW